VCPGLVSEEVPIELEQMDSADPPLAVYGIYASGYRQHRRHSTQEVHRLDGPLGGDPARITVFHWSLLVRATVYGQMAEKAIDYLVVDEKSPLHSERLK
jgi:hypothetical protein